MTEDHNDEEEEEEVTIMELEQRVCVLELIISELMDRITEAEIE